MTDTLPQHDLDARVAEAVAAIRAKTARVPAVGLTLGSGLGGVVDAIDDAVVFPTAELPHWPRSTVVGHAGRLAVGTWQGVPVVALAGRSHFYEGYPLARARPTRGSEGADRPAARNQDTEEVDEHRRYAVHYLQQKR